jgi:hypothetical protein
MNLVLGAWRTEGRGAAAVAGAVVHGVVVGRWSGARGEGRSSEGEADAERLRVNKTMLT